MLRLLSSYTGHTASEDNSCYIQCPCDGFMDRLSEDRPVVLKQLFLEIFINVNTLAPGG